MLLMAAGDEELGENSAIYFEGKADKPEFIKESDEAFQCFMLTKDLTLYQANSPYFRFYRSTSQNTCQALGSGSDFVLAALNMHYDTINAMNVAKKLDIYSGGNTVKGWLDKGEWKVDVVD